MYHQSHTKIFINYEWIGKKGDNIILKSDKSILNESKLKSFRDKCKRESKKVVLVTGVFDILHVGHLKFLESARELGDVLIVGINDNEYVRKSKGENRPIRDEYDRAYLIAGFNCVDCVHIYSFGNDFYRLVKPDILIMSTTGGRKPEDRKDHADIIKEYSGEVVLFDAFSTVHSSEIIEKIKM